MSMVDRSGVRVVLVRAEKPETESSKDMIVIGLRSQGFTWRQIGKIMKVSHVAAYKRWRAIPEEARSHYSQAVG